MKLTDHGHGSTAGSYRQIRRPGSMRTEAWVSSPEPRRRHADQRGLGPGDGQLGVGGGAPAGVEHSSPDPGGDVDKGCSPMRVRMPAQDSRSAHGLLYLPAVPGGRRKHKHCQGRVDIGPATLTAPEAASRLPRCLPGPQSAWAAGPRLVRRLVTAGSLRLFPASGHLLCLLGKGPPPLDLSWVIHPSGLLGQFSLLLQQCSGIRGSCLQCMRRTRPAGS